MLQWFFLQELYQERYQERMREAQQAQLVKEALAVCERRTGYRGQAIVWLGARLVTLGRRMQAWGGSPSAPSTALLLRLPPSEHAHAGTNIAYLPDVLPEKKAS